MTSNVPPAYEPPQSTKTDHLYVLCLSLCDKVDACARDLQQVKDRLAMLEQVRFRPGFQSGAPTNRVPKPRSSSPRPST